MDRLLLGASLVNLWPPAIVVVAVVAAVAVVVIVAAVAIVAGVAQLFTDLGTNLKLL